MLWDRTGEGWLFELQKRLLDEDAEAILDRFQLTIGTVLEVSEAVVTGRAADGAIAPHEQLLRQSGQPSPVVHDVEVALILLKFSDPTGSYVLDYPTAGRMHLHSSGLAS